jgi:hypothetical protein
LWVLFSARDLFRSQPETRGRAGAIIPWHPHLFVDSHERGSLDTYLFDPPNDPHNIHLSPMLMKWRKAMGAGQAQAFDQHGEATTRKNGTKSGTSATRISTRR